MLRAILAAILVGGLTGVQAVAQAGKAEAPEAELVPDPRYTPRSGDRAHLIADPTPGFARPPLFDDYAHPSRADDLDALRAMIDKGELVELEAHAPVEVIRNLAPADAREPGRKYPVEVRLLSGPRAGESWFVPESSVARLVPKVVHPPMAEGSLAEIARPETTLFARWDALDAATRSPGAATGETFRLDAGVKVVILERRGEAVRVRVYTGSKGTGRVGVMARSGLRPVGPPSRRVGPTPAAGPRTP